MSAILEQLGIDRSLFIQMAIYVAVFFLLSQIYFKPFLRLIETRHKKTVQDRESAEKIMAQAEERLQEYTQRLAAARLTAKASLDQALDRAKKEESEILSHARNEAKKITQAAATDMEQQVDRLRKELENEVEGMSRSISEKLLLRKV